MSAQFVSLAVGYALAGGLRRKGIKRRPWLELRRLEPETTYLLHQVRALQRSGTGTVRVDVDTVAGSRFYDQRRARLHSPLLERAIELLDADGDCAISPQALQVAGLRGLACLWLDIGCWDGVTACLPIRHPISSDTVHKHLTHLGIPCSPPAGTLHTIKIAPEPMQELARLLRPHVHRSMRHALRPGSLHGRALMLSQ